MNLFTVSLVKISGRFIRQEHQGAQHQCSGQGHALLFPPGKLPNPMTESILESDPQKDLFGAGLGTIL